MLVPDAIEHMAAADGLRRTTGNVASQLWHVRWRSIDERSLTPVSSC